MYLHLLSFTTIQLHFIFQVDTDLKQYAIYTHKANKKAYNSFKCLHKMKDFLITCVCTKRRYCKIFIQTEPVIIGDNEKK